MLICRRGWAVGKNDLFPAFLCPWLILLIVIFVNQSSCRKFTAVRLQKQMPVSLTVQRKELQVKGLEKLISLLSKHLNGCRKFDYFLRPIKCDVILLFSFLHLGHI